MTKYITLICANHVDSYSRIYPEIGTLILSSMWMRPYHVLDMHAKLTLIHLRDKKHIRAVLWSNDPFSDRSQNELDLFLLNGSSMLRVKYRTHCSKHIIWTNYESEKVSGFKVRVKAIFRLVQIALIKRIRFNDTFLNVICKSVHTNTQRLPLPQIFFG